jgi:tRNA/tmRNA/rRNA uracil-C5-methylase (TrmA/RlmC/RlmD family)
MNAQEPGMSADSAVHDLEVEGITHGAEGVARLPHGKACFVAYALPGERVRARVVDERKRWARAELVEVLEASPDRVEPPCPYAGPWPSAGGEVCGGCALQHARPDAQLTLKRRILVEQLQHLAGLADPPVGQPVATGPTGYRSRARFSVTDGGELGFAAPRSSRVRPIDRCLLLTEEAQGLRDAAGDAWQGCRWVGVHAGSAGGGLLVRPGPGALPPLPAGDTPVAVVDRGSPVALRGDPTAVEEVDGLALRVSAGSFFQAGPEAAAALVAAVRQAAGAVAGRRVVDLYAGVGLMGAALGRDGAHITAVEGEAVAADDARANLAETDAQVVCDDVAAWLSRPGPPPDVAVLDPPRAGAGREVCRALAAWGPSRVVYVSCDPAALARDVATLSQAGFELSHVTPVDCFPHTAAIEAVASLAPTARA